MTNLGGVEQMLSDFLMQSHSRQFLYYLLTTSSSPESLRPIITKGVPFFQPQRRFHYDPNAILQMASWLRSQHIQILHSYNAYANSWGSLAAYMANVPMYISGEHGSVWWVKPPMSWLDSLAQRRAKLIIANSRASAITLSATYRIPQSKIRVVYNGVPPLPQVDSRRVKNELGFDDQTQIVGSIGRLDTPKDFSTFVDAAAIVTKKLHHVIFLIVGGGPLESELRKQIRELDIEEKCMLTGWRADARMLVQVFDLFVSTSIHEAFGNALVEASLAGKPIIAPKVDGISEVVLNGTTGVLLNPTKPFQEFPLDCRCATLPPKKVLIAGQLQPPKSLDANLLARTIIDLLNHQELRRHYGNAGRERALNLFSIDRYIFELESIYESLIG
jgi:glycosyltransferase involved in cell wall biosynthesis